MNVKAVPEDNPYYYHKIIVIPIDSTCNIFIEARRAVREISKAGFNVSAYTITRVESVNTKFPGAGRRYKDNRAMVTIDILVQKEEKVKAC